MFRAVVDLTGLKAGSFSVQVQVQIPTRPVRIISVTPQAFSLVLEPLPELLELLLAAWLELGRIEAGLAQLAA